MYPSRRADQIFPSSCADYTSHLGPHQAEAFTLLWQLHDSDDPHGNVDGAGWHINQGLKSNEGIQVAPQEVQAELFEALRQVETSDRASSTATDVHYAGLFLAIAGWQHEVLPGNLRAFSDELYE